MVSGNGGMPAWTTGCRPCLNCRLSLRLESDFPYSSTCAGLAPSPARCCFPKVCTVFVSVFFWTSLYSCRARIVKYQPPQSANILVKYICQKAAPQNMQNSPFVISSLKTGYFGAQVLAAQGNAACLREEGYSFFLNQRTVVLHRRYLLPVHNHL